MIKKENSRILAYTNKLRASRLNVSMSYYSPKSSRKKLCKISATTETWKHCIRNKNSATISIEGAQRLRASENIYIKAVGFDFEIDRWSRNHTVKPSLLTLRKVLIFEFVTKSCIEPLWHWFTDGLLPGTTHCYLSRTESVANWIL